MCVVLWGFNKESQFDLYPIKERKVERTVNFNSFR